jgi:hypothetical protein
MMIFLNNKDISMTEAIVKTTIKIVIRDKTNNNLISSGTGFFYAIQNPIDKEQVAFSILTNKHVINEVLENDQIIDLNIPILKNGKRDIFPVSIKKGAILLHDDPDVDLALIYLNTLFEDIHVNLSVTSDAVFFTEDDFPPENMSFRFIEDILMIGYPIGIEDNYNHYPIVRKGITATNIQKRYRNKNEFLADISIFPGSSGSPVVFYSNGYTINEKTGSVSMGFPNSYLIGVAYSEVVQNKFNELEEINIPNKNILGTFNNSSINLGFIISYKEIKRLQEKLNAKIKKNEEIITE